MARRNSMLDAIKAFNLAYDTTTKVGQDIELGRAANAQMTELAPVSDLTATPSEDGGPAVTTETQVAPKQFSLLGKTYDQAPTDAQQTAARNMAMAGIMKKYDPAKGMQMEQSAASAQRDEQRFVREQKDWQLKDDEQKRVLEHRTKRADWLANSPLAKHQAAMTKFEQDTATYNEGVKAGKSPQEMGLPPQKPNTQRPGPLEVLASYAQGAAIDFEYGKLTTEGLMNIQDKWQTLQKENYSKALQVAQAGGTPEQIAKAFNSAGQQIDPKNITVTRTKQADGPDQVMLNYKDEKGRETSLNVMAELESYDKAKQVFDRFYQGETNRRGNESLNIQKGTAAMSNALHGAQLNKIKEENKDRADLRVIRTGLTEAITAGDKPTEDKLRKQLMVYGTGIKGASNSSPEERRALFYLASGAAKDETEAARMAHEKVQASAADNYMKLKTPNSYGLVAKDEDVGPVMAALHGENWREQMGNKGKAVKDSGMATDPKAIAIRDDKNLTLEQKRSKLKELGYQ